MKELQGVQNEIDDNFLFIKAKNSTKIPKQRIFYIDYYAFVIKAVEQQLQEIFTNILFF